jgi:hypothetical protein
MSRVYYDPDNDQWVHADTGNRISAWEVRNTEPHASEIAKRGGSSTMFSKNASRVEGNFSEPGTVQENEGLVPIPPTNPHAEEEYVEEILTHTNYA